MAHQAANPPARATHLAGLHAEVPQSHEVRNDGGDEQQEEADHDELQEGAHRARRRCRVERPHDEACAAAVYPQVRRFGAQNGWSDARAWL